MAIPSGCSAVTRAPPASGTATNAVAGQQAAEPGGLPHASSALVGLNEDLLRRILGPVIHTPTAKTALLVSRTWNRAMTEITPERKLVKGPLLQPTLTLGGQGIYRVAWSPDGSMVATGSVDGTARVWNSDTGELKPGCYLVGHMRNISFVAWSQDSSLLATASYDSTVAVWKVRTGKLIARLKGHSNYVFCVAWSTDGVRVATASCDGTVAVWHGRKGERTAKLDFLGVSHVDWSPDGSKVAVCGSGFPAVLVWKPEAEDRPIRLICNNTTFSRVSWSPDGSRIVSTGWNDRTAAVWEVKTGKRIAQLVGHSNIVRCVAWSPDGSQVATGSQDRTAAVWDARTGERLLQINGHENAVSSVSWSLDSGRVASACGNVCAAVWSIYA